MDSGQYETLNALITGGTSPYTVNFYNVTGGTTTLLYSFSNVIYNSLVSVPANILYYIPITFENQNSVALSANTPLAVGVSNGGVFNGAKVIGFNVLKYKQYYTCNLNDAEFFYANGTVAKSWLEGNIINEQTANSACTSSSSINALAASTNVLYWILPNNAPAFLPANTGTATTNTIYLGWAGNVISSANTLLSNVLTGEAPQLSCQFPANTVTGCGSTSTQNSYGYYDNGNQIFDFYDNFSGTTLDSAWTSINGVVRD